MQRLLSYLLFYTIHQILEQLVSICRNCNKVKKGGISLWARVYCVSNWTLTHCSVVCVIGGDHCSHMLQSCGRMMLCITNSCCRHILRFSAFDVIAFGTYIMLG